MDETSKWWFEADPSITRLKPRNDLPRFPEHARRDVHGIEDGEQVVRHVRRDSPEVRVDLYVEVWNKESVEQSGVVSVHKSSNQR